MEGPIIKIAYNVKMRAVALENHKCVSEILYGKLLSVYREKMYTITSDDAYTQEYFNIETSTTSSLKEMLDFLLYHTRIAIDNHELTKDQTDLHIQAIDMIENEIKSRLDYEKVVSKLLLVRLIDEKVKELEILKSKLADIEDD